MICFIHIPKTAGSYVNELFRINGYKILTHYEDKSLNNKIEKQLLESTTFLSGHFQFYKFKQVSRRIKKKFKYFTIIRNPIERIFSNINFEYTRQSDCLSSTRSFKGIFNTAKIDIFSKYFICHIFLNNKPHSILENSFFYKLLNHSAYKYFYDEKIIDFEKLNISKINLYLKKIKIFFEKKEVEFFDNSDLSILKKKFNLKSDNIKRINISRNFLDYNKIDREKFFNKSFKYIYTELIIYYYFITKNLNLSFKNKDDFKNFFYDFFLEIYPKFKVKVSKIENLDLLKKNFEDITIREGTLSEAKLYRLFGSINKINEQKIEFNKSRGVPIDFDEITYYKINEDVYKNKVDAYDHYLKYGKDEGRLYSRHEYIYNEVENLVFERFINI